MQCTTLKEENIKLVVGDRERIINILSRKFHGYGIRTRVIVYSKHDIAGHEYNSQRDYSKAFELNRMNRVTQNKITEHLDYIEAEKANLIEEVKQHYS